MAAYRRVDDLRSPAGWLPVHRDQLLAQRSVSSMGSLYLYLFYSPVISRTWLFACDVQVTLPVPTNPVVLKKAAAAQAAKEQKEAKEAKAREKAAAAATARDDAQKEQKTKEDKPKPVEEKQPKQDQEKTEEEEEKATKDGMPASWLKPVKWFMGQYAKESGTLLTVGNGHSSPKIRPWLIPGGHLPRRFWLPRRWPFVM